MENTVTNFLCIKTMTQMSLQVTLMHNVMRRAVNLKKSKKQFSTYIKRP